MTDSKKIDATDALLDATTALLPPLLAGLEALAYAGRHLHPPTLDTLVESLDPFTQPIQQGLDAFDETDWPEHLSGFRRHLTEASQHALNAFEGLRDAPAAPNPVFAAYRSMGYQTRAVELLYPIAGMLPPVSRFYLDPDNQENDTLLERLAIADSDRDDVGVMHAANGPTERGGFSMYVPEYYDESEALPLIVALHGGSGHGRTFLWTWLREARSYGAIVVSPSSREGTWSLMGPDTDSSNLDRIVEHVVTHWKIDDKRILLTGMSDGGTFSYVTGLRDDAAFTHLAPCSASFHPLLLEGASRERLEGLPVYLMHGALDWMFPVDVARTARDTLTAAGARVVYREIDDLSHTYPREENAPIMRWLSASQQPTNV